MFLTLVAMVPGVLFLYSVLSVLAVLYAVVDSFGALAHHQDHSSMWELEEMKAGKKTSSSSVTKDMNS